MTGRDMSPKIIFLVINVPGIVAGLGLIFRCCADMILRGYILGFNWRTKQWRTLNTPRSYLLFTLRFIFGVLLFGTGMLPAVMPLVGLPLPILIVWLVCEIIIGYQHSAKSKRQPT